MQYSLEYPETKARSTADMLHGTEIIDSYRWLENEQDPAVTKWVERQNEFTDAWFDKVDTNKVYRELETDMDTFTKGTPWRCGDSYFWFERQPGQQHPVLFTAADPSSKDKQEVLDTNRLSGDGSVSLSWFSVSKNANYAVYALQEQGSERNQIYIRDMASGQDEEFYFGRLFGMNWDEQENGFYYVCSNYKARGGEITDEIHYQQSYYHRLGEDPGQDKLLFEATDYLPKEAWLEVHATDDDAYVLIEASVGFSKTKLYLLQAETDRIVELLPGTEALHGGVLLDGYLYLDSNYQANNRQIWRVKIEEAERPLSEWEVFIPEDSELKLETWQVTSTQIIVEYIHKATSRVFRLDRANGQLLGELDLPELSSLSVLQANQDFDEFYYAVSTFLESDTKYRYDPKTARSQLHWKDPCSLDSQRFLTEQVWYTSFDGTQIPMFIVRPKDMEYDGSRPALLTGYGGFAVGEYPDFIGGFKPWLERGGSVALPNLRGGDEFGERWHQAGMLGNKQNVFDDMNAAAEYLVEQKYTCSDKLAITGGSNGGLLVGACITQRPELYRAAVCRVPLLDMLRYPRFLMARLWIYEYGDPDDPEAFAWLFRYSPYHNLQPKREYPSLLLTAGMHDSRVHPMHAWKMAAALQSMRPKHPVLLRTETKAGHGPGKGFYQALHDAAERLSFLLHETGVKI